MRVHLAAAFTITASALPAQLLVVDPLGGGTHTDLQTAIDAAPSGAVIHVRGGVWGALVITRTITIVGENAPRIRSAPGGPAGTPQPPAITLQGTGTESAVIAGLEVIGTTGSFYSHAGPGIAASGFRHVAIHDSTVRGHDWLSLYDLLPGASAVAATGLATLHVARSTLGASPTHLIPNNYYTASGAPGIAAPGASVVVLDSTVTGGDVGPMTLLLGAPWPGPCPCGPAGQEPGRGGPGIVAQAVFASGSTITGGTGSVVSAGWNPTVLLGTQPPGAPVAGGTQATVAATLAQTAPLRLGSSHTIGFAPTALPALLVLGAAAPSPANVIGVQHVLIDVVQPLALHFLPVPSTSFSLSVPANAQLLGFALAAQRFDVDAGGQIAATNPLIAIVLP